MIVSSFPFKQGTISSTAKVYFQIQLCYFWKIHFFPSGLFSFSELLLPDHLLDQWLY